MWNAWSRRFMISIFGESGFSVFHAGHWLWQRPHSVQVAKSSMPFHEKSSIEPMPRVVSSSISSRSSRVTGLPPDVRGLAAPSATRLALEQHVQRRHEDVEVLAVEHDHQEHQHHADVEQQPDPLEHVHGVLGEAVERVAKGDGEERAAVVGEVARPRTPRRGTGTSSR